MAQNNIPNVAACSVADRLIALLLKAAAGNANGRSDLQPQSSEDQGLEMTGGYSRELRASGGGAVSHGNSERVGKHTCRLTLAVSFVSVRGGTATSLSWSVVFLFLSFFKPLIKVVFCLRGRR